MLFENAFHEHGHPGPGASALVPINCRIGCELFKQTMDNQTQCIVAEGLDSTLILSERVIERDVFFGQPLFLATASSPLKVFCQRDQFIDQLDG